MRYTQRKLILLLMLALGLAIYITGTVYASGKWKTADVSTPMTPSRGEQPAIGTIPQVNAIHPFMQPETFQYDDHVHGLGMSNMVIVPDNDTPITGLAATNSSPTSLGNTTNFSATIISGTNVSYAWQFGDGGSGMGKTVSHPYAASGIYTATVTATNSQGSQTVTTTVYATNQLVEVYNNFFTPISTTVNVGDMVTWVRQEGFHNMQADDGSFHLGDPNGNPSDSWTVATHKFTQAGIVNYYCQVHGASNGGGMAGIFIVQDSNPVSRQLFLPLVLKQ